MSKVKLNKIKIAKCESADSTCASKLLSKQSMYFYTM